MFFAAHVFFAARMFLAEHMYFAANMFTQMFCAAHLFEPREFGASPLLRLPRAGPHRLRARRAAVAALRGALEALGWRRMSEGADE
jgi:hypothetical protein